MAASERQVTNEHRDHLVDLLAKAAAANNSHSLDQISLEVEERLADRRFVSERLFGANGATGASGSTTDYSGQPKSFQQASSSSVSGAGNSGNGGRQMRHFALGAQLESDAALQWLAGDLQQDQVDGSLSPLEQLQQLGMSVVSSSSAAKQAAGWPEQVCRLCRAHHQAGAISAKDLYEHAISDGGQQNSGKANRSSDLYSHSSLSRDAPDAAGATSATAAAAAEQDSKLRQPHLDQVMLETVTTCSELADLGNRSWIRPFVLVLQSSCVMITLALIGILFKCRKSRVSSGHGKQAGGRPAGRTWPRLCAHPNDIEHKRIHTQSPRLTRLNSPHYLPPIYLATLFKIILVSGWLMLETTLVGALMLYSSVSRLTWRRRRRRRRRLLKCEQDEGATT